MFAAHAVEPFPPGLQAALKHLSVEELLAPVLVQLLVIILAARLFAWLFQKIGQPAAVGEIAAGLLLGPSLLGWVWKEGSDRIFYPGLPGLPPGLADQLFRLIFITLSQLGLVLLLFLIGLEFDFRHLRRSGPAALAISLAGIVCPFLLGAGLVPLIGEVPGLLGPDQAPVPQVGFALFMGTALSITALPILGRMLMELNVTRTRLAAITIAAAATDDACGWIILASVTTAVRSGFAFGGMLLMVAETTLFGLVMVFLARPLLIRWLRNGLRRHNGELSVTMLAGVLGVMLVCALMTSFIGIFAIFGSFLLGAVLSTEADLRRALHGRLHDFVAAFFLPIFFTYTGLRTNVGSLETGALWLVCLGVLAAAIVGKFGGTGLAARLTGFSWRESGIIGVLMNTRALMELIVINLGKDLGVLPESVFVMLVLMALVTTAMTTPLLFLFRRGTELEPYLDRSPLAWRRKPSSGEKSPPPPAGEQQGALESLDEPRPS